MSEVTVDKDTSEKAAHLSVAIDLIISGQVSSALVKMKEHPDDEVEKDVRVTFNTAKVKHLSKMIQLFSGIISSFDELTFSEILQMIATKQAEAVAEGRSPHDVSITNEDVLKVAMDYRSVLVTVVTRLIDHLGPFVEIFSSISDEQFQDLDIDQATLVVLAIIGMNYSFFTQTLPPALKGLSLKATASKVAAKSDTKKAAKKQ